MSILYFRFAVRGSEALRRSALLERLIARSGAPSRVDDWRTEAFRVIAPGADRAPAVAAAIATPVAQPIPQPAATEADPAAWTCVATPVHCSAGMHSVAMAADGILELAPQEGAALSAGFNQMFGGGGMRLAARRGGLLTCSFDAAMDVETHDPEEVAGHDVFGFQPGGPDGARLRRLMSELEMWLFDHPINRDRAARGLPPVTGLWLWGGGAAGAALPPVQGWCAGRDPLFAAFGSRCEYPRSAGSGVVVCAERPGSNQWPEAERRWLVPAVGALRSGRLQRLLLSAADRRFSIGRAQNLRFWRRPRPWWESYGVE